MKKLTEVFNIIKLIFFPLVFIGEIIISFFKNNNTLMSVSRILSIICIVLSIILLVLYIIIKSMEKKAKNKYKNVYFISGTAYAGKSTMVKLLSEKYDGILCEENYHNRLLDTLDKNEYPNLCYTRDLIDWSEFVRRTPDEYEKWINDVNKECEKLELIILDDLVKNNKDKLIFVDTNISIERLKEISDTNHVLMMVADPDTSVNRFFDREDKDKQFIYQLLLKEEDVDKAMDNFKECLKRINNKDNYYRYIHSGFNYIIREDYSSIEDTLQKVEEKFKLTRN